jgi:SH3 domain protein
MCRFFHLIVLAVGFLFFITSLTCLAEEEKPERVGYISDFLVINLRDNIKRPFSVTGVVRSEEEVKITEEKEGYFRITTENGKTGWISKQYVKSQLPKSRIIKQLEEKIMMLEEQLQQGEASLPENDVIAELKKDIEQLQGRLAEKENEIARLSSGTFNGKKFESVSKENQFFLKQLNQLKNTYNSLLTEYNNDKSSLSECYSINSRLQDKRNFYWFGCGALVFLLGLLAGKIGTKKRNKFSF